MRVMVFTGGLCARGRGLEAVFRARPIRPDRNERRVSRLWKTIAGLTGCQPQTPPVAVTHTGTSGLSKKGESERSA